MEGRASRSPLLCLFQCVIAGRHARSGARPDPGQPGPRGFRPAGAAGAAACRRRRVRLPPRPRGHRRSAVHARGVRPGARARRAPEPPPGARRDRPRVLPDGENKAARQEFESVRRARPPEAVAVTIDQFLNALDARERSRRSGVSAFLEAGFGIDTNAYSATSASTFAIPGIGGLQFTLDPAAQEQDDKFLALSGGLFGRYAVNNTWSLLGSASFDQRLNADHDEFNTGTLN